MKKEFKRKNIKTLKKLEKQQSKNFNLMTINLLFVPIFLTYFSKMVEQKTTNYNDLYLYMRVISLLWIVAIPYGLYSLYKFMNLEKTLNDIRMDFQDVK